MGMAVVLQHPPEPRSIQVIAVVIGDHACLRTDAQARHLCRKDIGLNDPPGQMQKRIEGEPLRARNMGAEVAVAFAGIDDHAFRRV